MTSLTPSNTLVFLVLCAMTSTGCALLSTQESSEESSPREALLETRELIRNATQRAARQQRSAISAAPHHLVARFNPAPCQCPNFEVFLASSWARVYLSWLDAPSTTNRLYEVENKALDLFLENAHPLYLIRGRLTEERFSTPDGNSYAVLEIDDLRSLGLLSLRQAITYSSDPNTRTLPDPFLPPRRNPDPTPAPPENTPPPLDDLNAPSEQPPPKKPS